MNSISGHSGTAAIVVTWNRSDLLRASIHSLSGQSVPFSRIILVDNGSQDETSTLARQLPEIELIALARNYGFAGGVNRGIQLALQDSSIQFIALINNDVLLRSDWHEKALEALKSHRHYGSCATCLLNHQNPEIIDTAGIYWKEPGLADNYLSGRSVSEVASTNREVWGACAAAALYRREFFESVGFFDETLFAYQEDVDLALRGHLNGWHCVLAPQARGTHIGFGSNRPFPLGGTYADYYNARNRIYVLVKSMPGEYWQWHWKAIVKSQFLAGLQSISQRRAGAVLAGLAHGLMRLPRALHSRSRVFSAQQHSVGDRKCAGVSG